MAEEFEPAEQLELGPYAKWNWDPEDIISTEETTVKPEENIPNSEQLQLKDTIICGVCGDLFFSQENLEDHNKKMHETFQVFLCFACNKTFANKTGLMKHRDFDCTNSDLATSLGLTLQMCHICCQYFPNNKTLNQHHQVAHPQDRELAPKKLKVLPETTFIRNGIQLNNCHAQGFIGMNAERTADAQPQLTCNPPKILKPSFNIKPAGIRSANPEIIIINDTEKNPQNRFLTNRESQVNFINNDCPQNVIFCGVCGVNFTTEESLREHNNKEHYMFNLYLCTICNKSFAQKSFLTRHMFAHKQNGDTVLLMPKPKLEPPKEPVNVICVRCDELLQGWQNLKDHKKTCLKKVKRKSRAESGSYPCPECHRLFTRQRDIKRHMSRVHPDPEPMVFQILEQEFHPN